LPVEWIFGAERLLVLYAGDRQLTLRVQPGAGAVVSRVTGASATATLIQGGGGGGCQ